VTTDDWKEIGEGLYAMRIGASEWTAAGTYVVRVGDTTPAGQKFTFVVIVTAATLDDLVRSTTPANTLTVDASNKVGISDGAIVAATLGADCITSAKIADDALTADNFADDFLTSAHIADDAITGAMLATDAISADTIADNAIDAGAIASSAITADKIASDAITAAKIASAAITAAKIDSAAITAAKLDTDCITAAKIATGAIDADAIASDAITDAKIASDAITAAKIATGAIDTDALAADAVAEIADGVWDEATSGHTTSGTFGEQAKTDVDAILSATGSNSNGCKILLSQAISEGQTARTVGGALELTEAAERNKVTDTGVGGTRTVYRSNGSTVLAARSHTTTSLTP
jgi:hypothetical protein